MRGRIVFVNPETRSGLIFGADRQRYDFSVGEWQEPGPIKRNLEVNFQTQGSHALRIKAFSADWADQPPPAAAVQGIQDARRAPTLDDDIPTGVAGNTDSPVDPLFNDGIELPHGLEEEEPALTAKRGFGAATSALGRNVLLEHSGRPRHPAWHYYSLGLGLFLAFLGICYLARPLFAHH